jgi:hypothetical protein
MEADAPTVSEANGRGWSGQRDGRQMREAHDGGRLAQINSYIFRIDE